MRQSIVQFKTEKPKEVEEQTRWEYVHTHVPHMPDKQKHTRMQCPQGGSGNVSRLLVEVTTVVAGGDAMREHCPCIQYSCCGKGETPKARLVEDQFK